MFAKLTGVWVDEASPPERPGAPRHVREAQAIEWPRGEDGTILLVLTDVLGRPVELDVAGGDSATLYVSWDLRSGPQTTLEAAAGADAGSFVFTLVPENTSNLDGPMIFSVTAVKGGLTQQVVPLGYFTIVQGAAPP